MPLQFPKNRWRQVVIDIAHVRHIRTEFLDHSAQTSASVPRIHGVCRQMDPSIDVLLLDANSQGSSWQDMALLRRIHISFPKVSKILLLESSDRGLAVNAFRSGARGLFCFGVSPFRALCKCIQVVHRGQIWATAQQIEYLVDIVAQVPALRVVNANGTTLITPREEQVVALVAEGLSNREIAQELRLSEHTVKKYLFRIFDKLGISTRVELVLYAVNHGDHRAAEWLTGGA